MNKVRFLTVLQAKSPRPNGKHGVSLLGRLPGHRWLIVLCPYSEHRNGGTGISCKVTDLPQGTSFNPNCLPMTSPTTTITLGL